MKPFFKILIVVIMLAPLCGAAQSVVNVYARVTSLSGTSLSVTGATGTFTTGAAIAMQMQDSTIGNNTGNNNSFGNLSSIQSAGVYEIVNITAVSASTITLSVAPSHTFHFNNNSRVQIISYPTFGSGGNYTLNTAVTAPAWNGATGGVLAFKVTGTLTLNNNIKVDGAGFRGGAAGANAPGDYTCDPVTMFDNAGGVSTTWYGNKGEGIHNPNSVFTVARGKMLNGGGGGNLNNAGGGGGGNFTAGGTGGQGWSCSASTTGGGVGGADLSTYVSGSRIFMGGGGGGGQQNNSVGTAGGNGGGIIMISAGTIKTTGGCNSGAGSISISARGNAAANSGNDGAGGAGAGGSIILQAASYTANNNCPININSSGGDGGNVNNSGSHGAGGGGGKGAVILSGVVGVPSNVAVTDTAGVGGANDNTATAITASNGSSVANSGSSGIVFTPSALLPVQLSAFDAFAVNSNAVIKWQAAAENGFDYYEVERSVNNGASFTTAGRVNATGSNSLYSFTDNVSNFISANPKIYYRLRMVDKDGSFEYSSVRTVSFNQQSATMVLKSFPNPATATVYITSATISAAAPVHASIHDMQGRTIKTYNNATLSGVNTIALSLDGIAKGQYIITVDGTGGQEHAVITKQ